MCLSIPYSWAEPLVAGWTYVEWKLLWLLSAILLAALIRSPETKLRRHLAGSASWLVPAWLISSDVSWMVGRIIEDVIFAYGCAGFP